MADKREWGSRFLYAEDLLVGGEFKTVKLEIAAYHEPHTIDRADGQKVDKPALSFTGKDKMLVLCKTNISLIRYATGEPVGPAVIGKTITVSARLVDAFGDQVTAIRVIPPPGVKIRKGLIKLLGRAAEWKA